MLLQTIKTELERSIHIPLKRIRGLNYGDYFFSFSFYLYMTQVTGAIGTSLYLFGVYLLLPSHILSRIPRYFSKCTLPQNICSRGQKCLVERRRCTLQTNVVNHR